MKNAGLFLLGSLSGFGFFFQAAAAEMSSPPAPVSAYAATVEVAPVRAYPEDIWYQRALDNQVGEVEFINYLYAVLLHPETSEDAWEDALNSLIYIKRKEKDDTAVEAEVQERVYQLFAEVIADFHRTKQQRKTIMDIIAASGATSAVTILKEFVQTPFSDGLNDIIDPDEEQELRRDALSLIEDINIDSALQALYELVLFEPLNVKLKEKALDSLEDRQAYTHIRQLAVNALVSPDIGAAAFRIIVEHGELSQHIKAIAMASSADYKMRSDAIEELAALKAVRLLREIAVDPSVEDVIQERAFLKLIALRKERQDRRRK